MVRISNRKVGSRAYILNYLAERAKTTNPGILFGRMLLVKSCPTDFRLQFRNLSTYTVTPVTLKLFTGFVFSVCVQCVKKQNFSFKDSL